MRSSLTPLEHLRRLGALALAVTVFGAGCKGGETKGNDGAVADDGAQPPVPSADDGAGDDEGTGAARGGPPPEAPRPPSEVKEARDVQLDGVRIGLDFEALTKRAPFDKPCDADALPGVKRTVVVYSSRPCHDQVFPDGSSVLLLLPMGDDDDPEDLARPIEAIAWIGGTYFSTDARSNFPVAPGAALAEAHAELGDPSKMMQIGTAYENSYDGPEPEPIGAPLLAHRHAGDIWSISRKEIAVGFVAGPMPDEPTSEDWDAVRQLYFASLEDPMDEG